MCRRSLLVDVLRPSAIEGTAEKGSHNEIQTETFRKSGENVRYANIVHVWPQMRAMCTGDCISTPLQAITHYRSNYPDVATWTGVRWRPIIKVVTNTSDAIKSKLIVIKRNGVSAGELPLAPRFFAEIIDGRISV